MGLRLNLRVGNEVFVRHKESDDLIPLKVTNIDLDHSGNPFVELLCGDPEHRFDVRRDGFVRRPPPAGADRPPRRLFPNGGD